MDLNNNITIILSERGKEKKRKIIETSEQHNHDQNSIEKIEQQILRQNCKRKAEESISTLPIKIIRIELLNSSST